MGYDASPGLRFASTLPVRRIPRLRWAAAALPVAVLVSGMAPAAADGSTYTYATTATVSVGAGPVAAAVDPSTHTLYVVNSPDDTVSIVDGATHTVTGTISVGQDPAAVAVDSGTHTVYVANLDQTVSVIDGTTDIVTATIPVQVPDTTNAWELRGVAVDPSTHSIYVTGKTAELDLSPRGFLAVIDGTTNDVRAIVRLGLFPNGVAVDPRTHTVFVADGDLSGGHVDVINGTNVTDVIDTGLQSISEEVAVDSASHTLYVTTAYGDAPFTHGTVSIIDSAAHAVTATVGVGGQAIGVAVDSTTHTAYVANRDDNSVSVIDGTSDTVTDTIAVGSGPTGVAVDPGTHTAYVTNDFDNTVSVIVQSPVDTTPPVITSHPDVTATASGPAGATVTYAAPTATDETDGPVPVTCTPPSGSSFPIGVTTVRCTAADAGGNTATSSFTITVTSPIPNRSDLKAVVTGPSAASRASSLTYTLTVTNTGPGTASHVTAVLGTAGLAGLSTNPAGGTGKLTIGHLTLSGASWTVPTIAVGQSITLTVTGTVTQPADRRTSAIGGAAAATPDPNWVNNVSATTTRILP